jgi:transposase
MSQDRFAGVDWASEVHAVCVVNERGRIVEGRRYRHNEAGLRALCVRLPRLGVRLVALERPDGLLIERLLDAGRSVIAVHPNQVVAMRPRYSVAGGKSDALTALSWPSSRGPTATGFRVLIPDSDQTKALRALKRAREDLVRTRIGLANQLRDQLACFWPGRARCSARSIPRSRWRFCVAIPARWMPADSGSIGWPRSSLATSYNGRRPARELIARLRDAAERRGRSGSRWSVCRERYPSYRALAADAGQAPVAVESGKSRHAKFRWACDHRLREAFNVLADSSRHHSPWAADIYQCARARGAGHAHAARILGRAWSQIIWRLWHDHDTYNPNKHTARQRLATTHTWTQGGLAPATSRKNSDEVIAYLESARIIRTRGRQIPRASTARAAPIPHDAEVQIADKNRVNPLSTGSNCPGRARAASNYSIPR